MSQWVQLRIKAQAHQVEAAENALLALGAVSVTLQDDADQPILEPELGTTPIWDNTLIIGLFTADTDTEQTLEQFPLMFAVEGGQGQPELKWEQVEDKDWVRAWMDSYKPMQFGERLWICPSWCKPPQPDATNLMLDPGLAFGTGTHPTTALCLQYLDQAVEGDELVMDYGCGSGILGMAALLLGSSKMIGVDIDPQALIATHDNADRNGLGHELFDVYLPQDTPVVKADLTVANILAGPLQQLAPTLAELTRSGGKLALSGLLAHQADEVIATYSEWFVMNAPKQMEDWVMLSGIRK
ncbi:50S ribosomal protein L11 methyltransferase [Oceanobacter kriegii]|uniref:50S ribosomal protein L11 methyltransferase n=1 Tax=Oceanobacter kriegii TaxID=64972 RepID=UPI0003F4DB19|nr:50S ribosomal protein L11 methyltransferase [Oceanobacter kriegii]